MSPSLPTPPPAASLSLMPRLALLFFCQFLIRQSRQSALKNVKTNERQHKTPVSLPVSVCRCLCATVRTPSSVRWPHETRAKICCNNDMHNFCCSCLNDFWKHNLSSSLVSSKWTTEKLKKPKKLTKHCSRTNKITGKAQRVVRTQIFMLWHKQNVYA